jgi:hypothetical protein
VRLKTETVNSCRPCVSRNLFLMFLLCLDSERQDQGATPQGKSWINREH